MSESNPSSIDNPKSFKDNSNSSDKSGDSINNTGSNGKDLSFLKTKSFSELTPEELRIVEDAARKERKEKSEAALIEAWDFFVESVKDADLNLLDAVNMCNPSLLKGGAKVTAVKFRNPNNKQQSWRGIGRKPKWFTDNLAAGMTEDDMRA